MGGMDFSEWWSEILHEIKYLVFHNYSSFLEKKISSEIHVFRSDQFSLLMYRCLLPSSVTVKMEYERNIILCCIRSVTVNIRSMSLNTYNKNVDI